jgi:hypothetical protein
MIEEREIEDQTRWWADSPKDAVEYLEYLIFRCDLAAQEYHHYTGRTLDQSDATVPLPLDAAAVRARQGMRKGMGPGRQRLSHDDRRIRDLIIHHARRRKAERQAELRGEKLTVAKAEELAAEDARQYACDHHGLYLAADTILWAMRRRDPPF